MGKKVKKRMGGRTLNSRLLAIVIALLASDSLWGAAVENVVAKQGMWSDDVYIHYDIIDEGESSWRVSVKIRDGDGELGISEGALAGDIGDMVAAGKKRRITWRVGRDYAELWGEGFVVEVTAVRVTGELVIRGDDGTEIYVDGARVGELTEGELVLTDLDAVEHKVEARKKGSDDYRREVRIRGGANQLRLPGEAGTGDLLVKAPHGTRIVVDGVRKGEIRRGKFTMRGLPAGDYEVVLENPGGSRDVELRYSVRIKENEEAVIRVGDVRALFAVPAQGNGILSGVVRHYLPGTSIVEAYAGARVMLCRGGEELREVKADNSGVFRFSGLPTARYNLKVRVPTAHLNEDARGIKVVDGRETAGISVLIEKEFIPGELNVFFRKGMAEKEAQGILKRHGLEFVKRERARDCYLVEMPEDWYVPDVVSALKAEQGVAEAIPNYYVFYKK